ncbi:cupin domain-containing protein [Falsiroseomonas selenitidurans]|uniref:Cupin domain-containing protein n=1 Tax=Falsiroseomonas selenitidurans TaxID=2716335 RepID=A0ABX1E3E7_9PROT|nr:cupin domain-containing protein [Falsiroseomonas selenitidurans]NKC31288.1 cupin domain-containing protein [Falsiroseomonas selenitidurans]
MSEPQAASGVQARDAAAWLPAIPGERIAIRLHAAQVQGRFSVMESLAEPGCATPLHLHAEEETFYVIEGTPTFRLGDKVFTTAPGDLVLIPAGTPHAWINAGEVPSRMIATFAPGGVEALFSRIAELPPEELVPLAASYGTILLGPPMTVAELA